MGFVDWEEEMYIRGLFTVVLPIALVVSVAWYLSAILKTDGPIAVAVIIAGLIGFVYALDWMHQRRQGEGSVDESMRTAIAAAIVVQYLALVGVVSVFGQASPGERLSPITETLIGNFTTIVGVVIAFYFGSSALVQAHKIRYREHKPASEKPKDEG